MNTPLLDRLFAKVDVRSIGECWPFTGYKLKGYGRIGLGSRRDGAAYAHRIVCEVAHGPPPPGGQARHLCGVPACCNPDHLSWGSQADNERDKRSHGTDNRGERHGRAKLTAADVREVRDRIERGETQRSIALHFGVAQQSISEIATGKTWGHLA